MNPQEMLRLFEKTRREREEQTKALRENSIRYGNTQIFGSNLPFSQVVEAINESVNQQNRAPTATQTIAGNNGNYWFRTTWPDEVSRTEKEEKQREDKERKKRELELKYKPGEKINDFINRIKGREHDTNRIKWLKIFQKCVLPENVRNTIEEALTVVLNSKKVKDWGIEESFEKGITNSILLYGPPGTGKTMIAESMAAVLGKNLMKLTTGDIQSQIPGQAERNIEKVFEQAKEENCMLLLDECDSLLYNRDAVGMIMASEINALLTQIENFDGVVLLTTNRLGKLDPALQRRIVAKFSCHYLH